MSETEKTTPVMHDKKENTDEKLVNKTVDSAAKKVQLGDAKANSNGVTKKAGNEETNTAGTMELKANEGENANMKGADVKSSETEAADAKGTDAKASNGKAEIITKGDTTDPTDGAKEVEKHVVEEPEKADVTENADPDIIEVTATTAAETSAKSAGEAIEQDLGISARKHYEFALPLVSKSPNLEKLERATERLVKALRAAPEEKSTTRGYGELALLYGRALLGFVVRGAADGDVLGDKAKAGDEEEVEKEEKEEENEEKEDTTEELCWTQLEVARLAFQKSGTKDRLCEATRTIGEFLLTFDQASAAGEEFGRAAELCDGRVKAECLYKRYLSLRRVSTDGAKKSLNDAIEVMSDIEGTEDVVKEMKGELMALGGEESRGVKRSAEVTVTRVTPKRKK